MNRPYKPVAGTMTFEDYMVKCGEWEKDIEKYCDQLECNLNVLVNKLKECAEVSRLLEKRLDKALNEILCYEKSHYRYTCSIDSAYGYYHKEPTLYDVKKRIMKEVQDEV